MERKIYLISLFALAVFILDGCGRISPQEKGRYYNIKNGFSVQFPDKWEIKTDLPKMGGANSQAIVAAVGPSDSAAGTMRERALIWVTEFPQELTLEEFYSQNTASLSGQQDFKLYKEGAATIGGADAKSMVFSMKVGGTDAEFLYYWFLKGKKGYIIVFTCGPGEFQQNEGRFEEIARSFRFE